MLWRKCLLCGYMRALFVVTLRAHPITQWGPAKERSDHRNRPRREKKLTKHCQTMHSLPSSGLACTNTFPLLQCVKILQCCRLSGYILILHLLSLFAHLNSAFHSGEPQDSFVLLHTTVLQQFTHIQYL